MFDIMHTHDILGWVKRPDIEIVQSIILIELSDLIGFGYDLRDTQDGHKCWRTRFIICGKHPLLLTRIQVSDPGAIFFLYSNIGIFTGLSKFLLTGS